MNAGEQKTIEGVFSAARAALERGEKEEAARGYHELARLFRHKKGIVKIAAEGLVACGKWTEAVALLNSELELSPLSPQLLLGLANAFMSVRNFARAATYIDKYL